MAAKKSSKYFFRRHLISDRNATITMASNGEMVFLSNWDVLPGGKSQRDKDRSIFFNLERWKSLCYYIPDLNSWIQKIENGEELEQKIHLGGNLYAGVSSEYARVDMRFWFIPRNDSVLKAGKPGIALTFEEWNEFQKHSQELNGFLNLDNVQACMVDLIHQSQRSAMNCKECHPPDRYNMDQPQQLTAGPSDSVIGDQREQHSFKTPANRSFVRPQPYYNPRENQNFPLY
jgi:hypothetical protein